MRIVLVRFVTLCTTLLLLILVSCSALAASGEIVYENVTMNSVLAVDSGKTLTMELKGENFFNRGISVPKGSTLIIKGNGSMKAQGTGFWGCGIGGNNCGTIIIESGNITAGGGTYGYAIGGESFEEIQINGGTVIANGANRSTTIGGINASSGRIYISDGNITVNTANSNGIYCGDNGTLFINGGTINVQGGFAIGLGGGKNSKTVINDGDITSHGTGNSGAAIGGGEGNTVTINGGIVNAICDTVLGSGGAAIGGGKDHIVTINRGNVTAQAGYYAAAIGGNAGVGGGTITINGGTVTAIGSTHDGAAIGGGQNGDGGNVIIRGGTVTAKFGIRYKDTCPDVIGRGNGGSTSGTLILDPHGTEIPVIAGNAQSDARAIEGSPFSNRINIEAYVSSCKFFQSKAPDYFVSEINLNGFMASRDGWPIPNYYKSFGYELNENGEYYYDDPMKFFSQGFEISSLIASIFSLKYQGNCFGLSLLAAAQYNNQIDLLQYLYPNGDNLNEKGYNRMIQLNNKSMYSLEGNDEVVDIIERAHFSQFSFDINDAEIGSWDWSYSKVLDHLIQDNPSPLVVNLDFSYGSGGGHTVVTDTTRKPEEIGDGIWKIYCYDSNSPQDSKGNANLVDWYYVSEPYLCLDTKQHTWYYQNDWQDSIYSYSYLSGKGLLPCTSIKFYDISKLTDRFFYSDFELLEQGKLDLFISDNITIFASQNEALFQMIDNNPIIIDSGVTYRKFFGNSVDTIPAVTFAALSLPIDTNPIISCQGETRFLHNNGNQLTTFFVDGNACVSFNDSTNLCEIQNKDDDVRLSFEIAIQNQDGKKVVYAKGELECGTSIVLQTQFSEDGDTVTAQTTSDEDLIETLFILDGHNEKTDYHKRSALNGTLTLSGLPVVNQSLVASVSDSNNTGVLTFSWKRDGVKIAEGTASTPTADDIGKTLTCEVTSTVENGCITATTAVITKQAAPVAPTNLMGVAPTSFAGKDGKIIGTTVEMELSDATSFASIIACGNGETGSLTAGTYYVRYKETETTYAGEYATVIVPEYIKKPPIIHYPESNQIVNVEIGQTANMSVVAENGIDYQWFVDRNDGKGYVELSDAGKESYSTAPVKKDNDGYCYFCRVSNADGMTDSCIFTLCVIQLDSFPETGDRSNLIFWMIVVAACSVTICLLVHKQKAE